MRHLSLTLVIFLLLTHTLFAEVSPMKSNDAEALSQANTHFALDLYAALTAGKDDNVAFSPFSISTALAMTWLGARTETATQMQSTLRFESGAESAAASFEGLLGVLDAKDKPYALALANRLWGQKGYDFLPAFLELSKKHYGAALQEVDFQGDPEKTRKTINDWVESKTAKKIKDLLAEGLIVPDTRLVLTNAIYFKGKWKTAFDKGDTFPAVFKSPGGDSDAQFMTKEATFGYADTLTAQLLEMSYDGDELSLVVVLPKATDGLADLEKGLSVETLETWMASFAQEKVLVQLPRFKAEGSVRLDDTLKDLGMKLAFSDDADLSGLNGRTDLKITAVVHKAFVEVNEEGSEAAAATAVVVGPKGAAGPSDNNVLRADHPFLFLIRHKSTNTLLFLGRVTKP